MEHIFGQWTGVHRLTISSLTHDYFNDRSDIYEMNMHDIQTIQALNVVKRG